MVENYPDGGSDLRINACGGGTSRGVPRGRGWLTCSWERCWQGHRAESDAGNIQLNGWGEKVSCVSLATWGNHPTSFLKPQIEQRA